MSDMLSLRYGVNLSAGSLLAQTGTVVMSNANSVTLGAMTTMSSTVVTASIPSAGITAISAGTTQVTSGQLVLSNSNGFSFGIAGQTVTASPLAASYWDNQLGYTLSFSLAGSSNSSNLSLQRAWFVQPISATRVDFPMRMSVAGSTAGSYTVSFGIYTLSGSTASRVSSASAGVTWNSGTNSTAASIYGGQSGGVWRSIPLATWNITPGEYLIGIMGSIAGVAGSTAGITLYGSRGAGGGGGIFTTGTPSLPASLHVTDYALVTTNGGQPRLNLAGSFS